MTKGLDVQLQVVPIAIQCPIDASALFKTLDIRKLILMSIQFYKIDLDIAMCNMFSLILTLKNHTTKIPERSPKELFVMYFWYP